MNRRISIRQAREGAGTVVAMPTPIQEPVVLANADERPGAFLAPKAPSSGELDARIERVFAGRPLLRDPAKREFVVTLIKTLHRTQSEIAGHYVMMGFALLDAQVRLRDDYDRLEAAELLPFTKGTASKLRQVALAVREGRLRQEELPPYTIAYSLAKLPPSSLERAKAAGIIRPDARRTEVDEFLRQEREGGGEALDASEARKLERRLVTLTKQRAKLRAQIELLEREMTQIEGVLSRNGAGNSGQVAA